MRAGKRRNEEREWRDTRPYRQFHVKRRPAKAMGWLEAFVAVSCAVLHSLNRR